jgi:hypothetical protein
MKNSGQALTEFMIVLLITILILIQLGTLLHSHWNRTYCAILVFEATHSALTGSPVSPRTQHISIRDFENRIHGTSKCGDSYETVELPKLESAQW